MAFAEITGTEAIGTTEWSLTTDTAGPDSNSTECIAQLVLDVSDMVAGDILQIRCYQAARSGDTQYVAWERILMGAQANDIWASEADHLKYGWDYTLDALAGTITVNWRISQIT